MLMVIMEENEAPWCFAKQGSRESWPWTRDAYTLYELETSSSWIPVSTMPPPNGRKSVCNN